MRFSCFFFQVLNSRKQEVNFGSALIDLVQGSLTFTDEKFSSATLTSIIEDLILPSTLANDYLASQFLIINQIEYSLPFVRNTELENELFHSNDPSLSINPFVDFNDLEDYLNRCERKKQRFSFPKQSVLYLRYDHHYKHNITKHSNVSSSIVSSSIHVLSILSSLSSTSILLYFISSIIRCE